MRDWWKEATVYQIYPRSFADSNRDGIGDLNGITSKLDYLKSIGVNVIWLCPIYKSPDADNGYDISNYTEISEKFGTIKDFDILLSEVHKRGMKLIMDAVFNHTSDEHRWFIESKKSKTSKYRNYYFWRKQPNNWGSHFGGSAWEYDRKTGEYYLHIWGKKQPDLNWDNKEVRQEIYKVMRWWLDRGVDGFRFDVINFISKTPGLPDAPGNGSRYADGRRYYVNGPKVNDYLKEMNNEVLSKYDMMSVGELSSTLKDVNIVKGYVGASRHELNMVFHENNKIRSRKANTKGKTLLENAYNELGWNLPDLKHNFTLWQKGLQKDWDSVYLGNHDYPRIVSRFGDDGKYRIESAKMLATLIFTLRGTPYMYQGDEIGMTDPKFSSIRDYKDIAAVRMYKEYLENYNGRETEAIKLLGNVSRDNARTPMQWDRSMNSGFTRGTPWIKLNKNYTRINVLESLKDTKSILHYYMDLIRLRKKNKALLYGSYEIILEKHRDIYAYTRKLKGEVFLIMLNFTGKKTMFALPKGISYSKAVFVLGNYGKDGQDVKRVALMPYEARVYRLG